MNMLKTHHFNLDFFKKGVYSKQRVENINEFEKCTIHALLTLPVENEVTDEFIFGDMYYIKDRQELIVFSFLFENTNIFSCGFNLVTKQAMQRDYLSMNFIRFITFNNFLLESGFVKENVVFIGNVFVDEEDVIKSSLLAAFNDVKDFDFKYSIKTNFSDLISFYEKESINYEFFVDDKVEKFNIFTNNYNSSKDLFLTCKRSNNIFTLPIAYLYFDKNYGEMEYITCQSGDIVIPDKDEEVEDLIVLLNKEGYTTLNLLSSINKDEVELKKNLYIKRNGYEVISLNSKSEYIKLMLNYL